MIELLNITVSLLCLILFSLFPLRVMFFDSKSIFYKFSTIDLILLNFIINMSLILLLSFTNIDNSKYFISLFSISIIYNLYNILSYKNYYKFFINKDFVFFIILNFVLIIYLVSNPILAWDGLENWYFKAQNFFYNYNFFDLKGLKGNNNYYPHLGSLIWGFFWKNSLLQYEYLGRLFFIYVYLLSIFSICELINNKNQFKIIILSIIIILSFDNFLFRGYQEVLLFSLFIFVSKNFYIYIKSQKTINLLLCFLCLNLIPWVKHEGFLFTLIFCFSILFIIKYFSNKLKIFSLILLTLILIIFKNYLFYKYLDLNFTHGGGGKIFNEFNLILQFTFIFFKGLLIAFIKYKIWILVFISIYFVSKQQITNTKDKLFLKFINISLVLFFTLLIGIYYNLFTNSDIDFNWWIDTSLDRLIYSISGLYLIYIIFFTNSIKNYIFK